MLEINTNDWPFDVRMYDIPFEHCIARLGVNRDLFDIQVVKMYGDTIFDDTQVEDVWRSYAKVAM